MGNEFIYENEGESDKESNNTNIKFVSLAPRVFNNLRKLHKVDEKDIMELFSISNLRQQKLTVKLQSGKGGSFFVIPENGKFLIKSISEGEYKVVKTIIADLYVHHLTYNASFINPIYGCYALYLSEYNEIEPQYFVLMKNALDINKELLPEGSEIICFDLKGSTAGRKTLEDPKATLLAAEVEESVQKTTLKDEDFYLSFRNVEISPPQGKTIMDQLEIDAKFFSKYLLIDYSLLLIVVNIPYRTFVSTKKDECRKIDAKRRGQKRALDLVISEKNFGLGKTELFLEERGKVDGDTYHIVNPRDVENIKSLDDKLKVPEYLQTQRITPRMSIRGRVEEDKMKQMESGGKNSGGTVMSNSGNVNSASNSLNKGAPSDPFKNNKERVRFVINFPKTQTVSPGGKENPFDLHDLKHVETEPEVHENKILRKKASCESRTVRVNEDLEIVNNRSYTNKEQNVIQTEAGLATENNVM